MTERKIRKTLQNVLPIETERLIIRYIQPDDAYDMYEYASVPEVSRYLLWYPHVNLAATEGYIESLQRRYIKGLYADWAIELKDSGKMIGTCGYASIDSSEKSCEIGYVLSPKFRKCGYISEAVAKILELSFEQLFMEKAILRIISENDSSIKIANRFGFKLKDEIPMIIKETVQNVLYYELTLEEYNRNKK